MNVLNQSKRYVLVTGGCGFIGSALLRRLVPTYPSIEFINVDDLREGSNEEAVLELQRYSNYHFIKAAVEEPDAIWNVFSTFPITDIIHLAADSDVDNSIKRPLYTANVNITGTLFLLEAARKIENFNRFVYVSTDEVYGDAVGGEVPNDEFDSQKPSSPYSASKSAAEGFVHAYHRTYDVDMCITRGANTFGPWQAETKLIPVAMSALREGRKVPLYGDGSQVREWLPVELHAEAIEKVWNEGISGETYNVSTGVSFTNKELVTILMDAVNAPLNSYEFVKDRAGHDHTYRTEAWKLKRLGWPDNPDTILEIEVRAALADTARWYYDLND